jgi:hypothetical protein
MHFAELVRELGLKIGYELENVEGACGLRVDDTDFILQNAGDFLLMRTDLGMPEEGVANLLMEAALEANYLYQGTCGCTLAMDRDTRHLHLQRYEWLDRTDADRIMTSISRFVHVAKVWKSLMAEAAGLAGSDSEDAGKLGERIADLSEQFEHFNMLSV